MQQLPYPERDERIPNIRKTLLVGNYEGIQGQPTNYSYVLNRL